MVNNLDGCGHVLPENNTRSINGEKHQARWLTTQSRLTLG
jgi:hypothetical protein